MNGFLCTFSDFCSNCVTGVRTTETVFLISFGMDMNSALSVQYLLISGTEDDKQEDCEWKKYYLPNPSNRAYNFWLIS